MSGKPAARVGDSVKGGKITSGSASVLIGDCSEGQADCPCKGSPAVGSPVNPMLGIKVLPPEVDFALPAPAPFVFARSYASDNTRLGALGRGWSTPGQSLGLELDREATVLIDEQGRRIGFSPLAPGQELFSVSESLWIRRGGPHAPQHLAYAPWTGRWACVPAQLQHDPLNVFVCSGGWIFHLRRLRPQVWRLLSQFDRHGYTTDFCWNGDGLLHEVRDSAARRYGFVYGRLREPEGEGGGDGDGDGDGDGKDPGLRLLGVILALPGQAPDPHAADDHEPDWLVRYGYDEAARLISVSDRSGEVQRCFTWGANDRLASHGQPGGLQVRYEWEELPCGAARVIGQHESVGSADDAGNANPGLSRRYVYHDDATEVHDSLGRTECYRFDGEGGQRRLVGHTRADGSTITYNLDWARRTYGHEDPLGRRFGRVLDGRSRVVGHFGPERLRTDLRLEDLWGEPIAYTDATGARWTIERDDLARAVAVVAPDERITRYAYDDERLPDRPTAITDAHGGVRRLRYNALGQVCEHTDCSQRTSTWEHDGEGRLVRHTDALGQTTRYEHDRTGRLTAIIGPDDGRTTLAYDALGRLTGHTDPLGRTTTYTHDRHGRVVEQSGPGQQRLRATYDAAGRLTELTNANGASMRFGYDTMDRLVEQRGFDGRVQHWRYNAAGELIEQSEHFGERHQGQELARITSYERDGLGRLTARHLPATDCAPALREHYRYDGAGRLLGTHSSVARTAIVRDKLGRIGGEVLNVWDPQGDAVQAPDGAAGALAGALGAQAPGAWQHVLALHRDGLGAVEASHIGSAPALQWLRYGPGHLHGLRMHAPGQREALLALDIERDALHREVVRQHESLRIERGYLPSGQIQHWHASVPGLPAWTRQHHWDGAGRLTAIDDSQHGPITYEHDSADRLVGSRHGKRSHRYAFDAAGNRLQTERDGADGLQDIGSQDDARQDTEQDTEQDTGLTQRPILDDRLTSLHGLRLDYDDAGNLRTRLSPDGTRLELGYDGAHRLVELTRIEPSGNGTHKTTHARYAYDPLGRRVRKIVRGPDGQLRTTHYGWDGDRLVTEHGPEHTWTWVYGGEGGDGDSFTPLACLRTPSKREPAEVAMLRKMCVEQALEMPALPGLTDAAAPECYLVCTDHLGTPLALVQAHGGPVWQARPHDWAGVSEERGNIRPALRLPGQWLDEESGLHYNRHRYYDPQIGRYISQDPIGVLGGINVYEYAGSRPTTRTDPLGLLGPLALVAWGAAAVAAAVSVKRCSESVEEDVKPAYDEAARYRSNEQKIWECLQNPSSCSGSEAQQYYNTSRQAAQQSVEHAQRATQNLGSSVPRTSITGPLPRNAADAAAGTAVNIISSQ